MPDGLVLASQTPGLWALLLTMAVAGVVRGFTGFGTALIFVPVAGRYLSPGDVIFLMTVTGVASNITLLPRALRDGEAGEVGFLVLGAMLTIPLGLWTMSVLDAQVVR